MTVLATTELEAVNLMLAAITEAPVDTLDDDTVDDAAMALSTLRQVSKEIQSQGWHFNTDYDYSLSVDGNNKIPVPVTAAHVDPMDHTSRDLVQRGSFLYDRENHTYTFTDITSVKCRVKWMLDFEDLPQQLRICVAMRAAYRFGKNIMGDDSTVNFSKEEFSSAWAAWVADDMRMADHNMLTGSRTVNNVIRRRRTWAG